MREPKIPHQFALSPRASSYVAREARRMQISEPEVVRRLIDREIERELRSELARLNRSARYPGSQGQ